MAEPSREAIEAAARAMCWLRWDNHERGPFKGRGGRTEVEKAEFRRRAQKPVAAAYPIIRRDVAREIVKDVRANAVRLPFWKTVADFIEREYGGDDA